MFDFFDTTYWFMFPVGICIAFVAMSTVVGGAMFFAAVFIFLLKLPIKLAIATAVTTQMFGFMSGMYFHARKDHIDYQFGIRYLVISIPCALCGVFLVQYINVPFLKIGISLLVIAAGLNLWQSRRFMNNSTKAKRIDPKYYVHFPAYNTAAVSSLLFGMTSIGLGEIFGYYMLNHLNIPSRVAVSTTIFIIFVTSIIVSGGYILHLVFESMDLLSHLLAIVKFTIPAVIFGAFLGTKILFRISPYRLIQFTSIVLISGGILFLITTIIENF